MSQPGLMLGRSIFYLQQQQQRKEWRSLKENEKGREPEISVADTNHGLYCERNSRRDTPRISCVAASNDEALPAFWTKDFATPNTRRRCRGPMLQTIKPDLYEENSEVAKDISNVRFFRDPFSPLFWDRLRTPRFQQRGVLINYCWLSITFDTFDWSHRSSYWKVGKFHRVWNWANDDSYSTLSHE